MAITNTIVTVLIYYQAKLIRKNIKINIITIVLKIKRELELGIRKNIYEEGTSKLLDVPPCDYHAWDNIIQISKYKIYIINIINGSILLQKLVNLLKKIPDIPQEKIQELEKQIEQLKENTNNLLENLLTLESRYNKEICQKAHKHKSNIIMITIKISKILLEIEKYEPLVSTYNA